jgi:hypothetical protein
MPIAALGIVGNGDIILELKKPGLDQRMGGSRLRLPGRREPKGDGGAKDFPWRA